MSEYFPEPKSLGGRVKVELDFSNYATKADLKNATCVDTSKLARKIDLASLKSDVGKLDIDKLKTTKKLTITQKLMKLKIKLLLIMIMINILPLKNLIS